MPFLLEKMFSYVFCEIIFPQKNSFSYKFLKNFSWRKNSPRLLKRVAVRGFYFYIFKSRSIIHANIFAKVYFCKYISLYI